MRADDLVPVLAWRNHPQIRRYMLSQEEILLDEHRRWFERTSEDPSWRLLIFENAGTPLGFVSFHGAIQNGIADWGFYAAPEAPKGTGRKLGRVALNFAFGVVRLHKVCGRVLGFNDASIRLHRTLGFQQEGVLREQHRIGNTYHDLVCFGLLQQEWSRNACGELP